MAISDQIQNYYEFRVIETLAVLAKPKGYTDGQMVDLACLALNNLPTRYFRHEVDLAFYMSAHEHEEINRRVRQAVNDAIAFIESHKANS
ncbi:competence protein ComFB [Bermanella sp. 47_1433_sub80_T6]|nr:competence protein ComFB [Bermanella sp. 47_1433_sub80_T6]